MAEWKRAAIEEGKLVEIDREYKTLILKTDGENRRFLTGEYPLDFDKILEWLGATIRLFFVDGKLKNCERVEKPKES